jgi:hypothetical protein
VLACNVVARIQFATQSLKCGDPGNEQPVEIAEREVLFHLPHASANRSATRGNWRRSK